MKREHIALPALQMAAATFLATSARAETYCVDDSSKVVAATNCNEGRAEAGNFSFVQGPFGMTLGDVISQAMKLDGDGGGGGGPGGCGNRCLVLKCTAKCQEC